SPPSLNIFCWAGLAHASAYRLLRCSGFIQKLRSTVAAVAIARSPHQGAVVMNLRLAAIAALCGMLFLSGCGGGGDDEPELFTAQIFSDPVFDGDIEQVSPDTFTITQGMSTNVQNVLVGIDPVGGTEFRAFLDFPLGGSGGVPGNAGIDSAFLEVFVDDLQPDTSSLPLVVELVAFQPPNLIPTAFHR